MYLHFMLQPNGEIIKMSPKVTTRFAYVIKNGMGYFGKNEQSAQRGQMVIFARDGDEVSIRAPADAKSPLDVLLLGPARSFQRTYCAIRAVCDEHVRRNLPSNKRIIRAGKMGRIEP